MKKNKLKLAWLAGIIDGEGSLQLSGCKNGSYYVKVSITNSEESMINEVEKICIAYKIKYGRTFNDKTKYCSNWKKAYYINICSQKSIIDILILILPYLINKKIRAKEIIKYCRSRLVSREKGGFKKRYTTSQLKLIHKK